MKLTRARFQKLAEAAFAALPREWREKILNVEVAVQARPGPEAGEWEDDEELLGLYVGLTRAEMLEAGGPYEPARVLLYQENLEAACASQRELEREIATTLRHELGHHFGFEDDELSALDH